MNFIDFKERFQKHVNNIIKNQDLLFVTDIDKDILWNKYLNNFPTGTNKIFRERREFDCSCCRHFIKSFGNIVVIKNNKLISIWDFETNDTTFQPVINALSKYVKSHNINSIFITRETKFGTNFNFEQMKDKSIHKWDHFYIELPKKFIDTSHETTNTIASKINSIKHVFKRSLEEISKDAIKTILDLIAQKSLYKGDEWKDILNEFLKLYIEYHKLPEKEQDNYCWAKSIMAGGAIGKIRNHSIGVLLTDISNGIYLNKAVKKYEKIVAPPNYKRPKAIFTKRMIKEAQKTITDLGYLDSLNRRYATIDDITINNILYANRNSKKILSGDIFSELRSEAKSNIKKFDKIEEIQIKTFIKDILPNVQNMQIYLENKHSSNLVSLISPENKDSNILFKWNNNFSWAYNGNITDSMKERVKSMGGNVNGVLRFSIQWNENFDNQNDFDAHCMEPEKNHIYYKNKRRKHNSSGMLDVDIINPENRIACENIIYTDLNAMPYGIYEFFVHVYSYRNGKNGFLSEIEFDDKIYQFEYRKDVKSGEKILVAQVEHTKKGLEIIKSIPTSLSSKQIWGLSTNNFHDVSILMYSPNYWDNQHGIGNKHYFFILNNCVNDTSPNGFFNEFLKEDMMKHKRVFEALGSKMKVKDSDNQLSGLGFSSTKRNSVICKLEGNFNRTIKLTF